LLQTDIKTIQQKDSQSTRWERLFKTGGLLPPVRLHTN
jgi:hypothetical protein